MREANWDVRASTDCLSDSSELIYVPQSVITVSASTYIRPDATEDPRCRSGVR
jgi:hypothetical protein